MFILSKRVNIMLGISLSIGITSGYSLGRFLVDKENECNYVALLKDIFNYVMYKEHNNMITKFTKERIYYIMKRYLNDNNYYVPNKLYFKTLYKKALNEFEDELRGVCYEK